MEAWEWYLLMERRSRSLLDLPCQDGRHGSASLGQTEVTSENTQTFWHQRTMLCAGRTINPNS